MGDEGSPGSGGFWSLPGVEGTPIRLGKEDPYGRSEELLAEGAVKRLGYRPGRTGVLARALLEEERRIRDLTQVVYGKALSWLEEAEEVSFLRRVVLQRGYLVGEQVCVSYAYPPQVTEAWMHLGVFRLRMKRLARAA